MIVRNEKETDHRHVEELIRKAFYNLYVPGCTEHYLARVMRGHEDFIPELDLVLELDGRVIGSILYTKAKLSDAAGKEKEILTFGPVCIAPEYQRMGYGRRLMFGSPANYVARGFKSCKKFNVCADNGRYPAAMLVKELVPGALDGRKWVYRDSPVMAFSEEEAQRYDDTLEKLEKKWQPSQEEFYILSHSFVE